MENDFLNLNDSPRFIGRDDELQALDQILRERQPRRPVFVSGAAGSGKTALVKHWLSSRRYNAEAIWTSLNEFPTVDHAIDDIIPQIQRYSSNNPNSLKRVPFESAIVIIDDCDLSTAELRKVTAAILNYKVVLSVVFISRKHMLLEGYREILLGPLDDLHSTELLKTLLTSENIEPDELLHLLNAANGYPLAIKLLSRLVGNLDSATLLSNLNLPLYKLSNNLFIPDTEIVPVVSPIIVSASNNLITSLKKQPADLHKLTPREFEILLSDLLRDMGWEVELTKQTRDGGADILAYLNTDVGRLLCLVEAKHYRQDRKIGVDLVRTLYGTLCDKQANSAMLVTSSSFTRDAREFQQKHEYQLSLRDYADIISWLSKYGNK
ncbi:restriction endonuclease [Pedobacter borealis]|uniref:restriction endonuclease n=1 Tax=Pedobacter borealis TaxID=475254 RepID=UPI00068D51A7|nr:restriction endonuclease [Pedobacter borealis]